jgi:deoxyribodipyrimidine photo-lyase
MRRNVNFTETMQSDFWTNSSVFPSTREAALDRLVEFEKTASRYGRDRNHVVPGHQNVSRLSPAIRHRLITEAEVAKHILHRYAFSTVEKFLQEVYWRRYWKSWLALRPQVWTDYLRDLDALEVCEAAQKVMAGEGEVEIMNDFVHELVETGYLHNHARMWFAGYWIHAMGLPWQLGADFFYQHLLDADPASNTLSWRWVAGLQTRGKTYLARRANIEKFLHPDLLQGREGGLELLANHQRPRPSAFTRPEIQKPAYKLLEVDPSLVSGFWLHSDDLSVDPKCHEVFLSEDLLAVEVKAQWLREALDDVESRLTGHCVERAPITDLLAWAEKKKLDQIIAYRPEVGVLNDELAEIEKALKKANVRLVLLTREEDDEFQSLATAGFFGFWKKIESRIRAFK